MCRFLQRAPARRLSDRQLEHFKAGYYSIMALNLAGDVPIGPDHAVALLEPVHGAPDLPYSPTEVCASTERLGARYFRGAISR